ncbi:glycosyltransferase family 2 protein [Candidatus Woesebacteria bacterium]|nr:glycosyltransferase family 2 protein [Candidatus Woesebacteria bacterium]
MATKISFVIPAKDEEESVEQLYKEIISVVSPITESFEIIFVDDGSTDSTFDTLQKINHTDKRVRVIRLRGNWGKAIALQIGFNHSRGEIVFTMDADLQDNPKDIPQFIEKLNKGFDLVVGWKKTRHDSLKTVLPSRILNNFLIPMLTGVNLHDNNCGYKAFKIQAIKSLSLYGELFRFIPILLAKQNFKITEVEVHHRKRTHGKTKFGWQKNIKGFLDLITIVFLTGYIRRPGHFFGGLGLLSSFFGFLIGIYITYLRITTGSIQFHLPLLIFGLLLMVIGAQLITTGLLAEMLTNYWAKRASYEKYIQEEL